MNTLASLLRSAQVKPVITAKPEPIRETRAPPKPKGPMIEFEKQDGLTTFVHVRSQGRVRTLQINRDEDGNMISATLLKV